jgi:hypothetical protein
MRKLFVLLISFTLIVSPVSLANDGEPGYWERNWDFYMKQGVMLINSVVGTSVIAKCPGAALTYSAWGWMAGSLLHIGLELFQKSDHESALIQKMENLKVQKSQLQTEGDSSQLEMLLQLKAEHEQIRNFMTLRRDWTWGVQIMYDVAVALAILEWTETIMTLGGKTNVIACSPSGPWVSRGVGLVFASASYFQQGGGAPTTVGTSVVALSALKQNEKEFLSKVGGIADGITSIVSFPPGRVGLFGANALLTYLVIRGLNDRIDIANQNITDIENVIRNFRLTNTDYELDLDNNPGGAAAAAPTKTGQIKKLGEVKKIPKCLANSGGNFSYNQGNCKSPVKITMPQLKMSGNFPTLTKGLSLGVDMANAMAAGDTEKVKLAGAELNSMAGRIKEIKNQLQEKLNADLKKAGKQPVDFDKEIKQQLAKMTAPVSSDVSFSPSLASTPPTSKSSEAKTTQDDNSVKIPEVVSPVPEATATLSESESTEVPEAQITEKSLDESLNEFEVPVEDISKESTVSIFQQVSNRYILNYTRFFEQKKSLEEARPVKDIPKPSGSELKQK